MSEDGKIPDLPIAAQPAAHWAEKWMRIALVASLGANIFLGGFVAARLLAVKEPSVRPEVIDLQLRGLPRGLSQEMREELEHSMRAYKREIRGAYGEYRSQQREINRLLVEERLDEKAITTAQRGLRALSAQIQHQMQRALVDAMRDMKAETRRGMIELRRIPQSRRHDRPDSVDGSRWRFSWRDEDGFQLDLNSDNMVMEYPTIDEPEPEEDGG